MVVVLSCSDHLSRFFDHEPAGEVVRVEEEVSSFDITLLTTVSAMDQVFAAWTPSIVFLGNAASTEFVAFGTVSHKAVVTIATFEFDLSSDTAVAKVEFLGGQITVVELICGIIDCNSVVVDWSGWNGGILALTALLSALCFVSTTCHDVWCTNAGRIDELRLSSLAVERCSFSKMICLNCLASALMLGYERGKDMRGC